METKPIAAQEARWGKQYAEIVKQAKKKFTTAAETPDDSSLAQPPAYEDVPTVGSTSAGDQPVSAD